MAYRWVCVSLPKPMPVRLFIRLEQDHDFCFKTKTKTSEIFQDQVFLSDRLCNGSPMLSDRCLSLLSCLSVCNVGVLWPNGWMDQDETWHAGRPRPWSHCVRWRPSSPPPKGAGAPQFRLISVAGKWLDGSRCHLVWT